MLHNLKTPEACPMCGSENLSWDTRNHSGAGIPEGRLRSGEVTCLFFLGCDDCSETLATITADNVAFRMTAARTAPRKDITPQTEANADETNSELESLAAENEKLRELLAEKAIDSVALTELTLKKGGLSITANGGIFRVMAEAFGETLAAGKAENYIEATFNSETYPEVGQIVVTARKEAGKTPHQLRKDAENERDQLRRLVAAQEAALERIAGSLRSEQPLTDIIAQIGAAVGMD